MAKRRKKGRRKSRSTSCKPGKGKWKICPRSKKKLNPGECVIIRGRVASCNTGTAKKPQRRFKKLSTVLK